jgi:cell division protein FtsB
LREAVISLLDLVQKQAAELAELKVQNLQLSNELRLLKGEKKSPNLILKQFLSRQNPHL